MTRNNKVPLLLGFGGLALVSLIALPSPKNDEAPPMQLGSFAPPATPPGVSATALPSSARLAERDQRSALLSWGRDLFHLPAAAPEAPEAPPEALPEPSIPAAELPQLTGICADGDRSWALIDRQIVRPGDRLESGHTVTNILDDVVSLVLGDQRITLTLGAPK